MSDEQRVRAMCGWIGVEISRSRVRTPGKAGYGLYRVRGSRLHIDARPRDGRPGMTMTRETWSEWTGYAFTLEAIEEAARVAIEQGRPEGPGLFVLHHPSPRQARGDKPTVVVPARWTSTYRGRRDLGLAELERTDPAVGAAAESYERVRAELVRKARAAPATVKPEVAAELDALGALLGAGLVEMKHVEWCACRDGMVTARDARCVRQTLTTRQRQRVDNAAFQADHLKRREYGVEQRHRAKLARNAQNRNPG